MLESAKDVDDRGRHAFGGSRTSDATRMQLARESVQRSASLGERVRVLKIASLA